MQPVKQMTYKPLSEYADQLKTKNQHYEMKTTKIQRWQL